MNQQQLIDILGWIGTAIFLIAYYLVSVKKVESDSTLYQGLNILAGSLLVINTLYLRAYPSLALNAAWIVIGLLALGRKRLGK